MSKRQEFLDRVRDLQTDLKARLHKGQFVKEVEKFCLEEALKNPELVYKLDLSEQDLTILPESIGNLTNLTYLYLRETKIEPQNIEKLRKTLPNCEILTE